MNFRTGNFPSLTPHLVRLSWLPVVLAFVLAVPPRNACAQTRQSLFDGKTLAGWHTEGEGIWTVSEGAIHARNPKKDWAHLVTNQGFQNGYVRMRFLNRAGNSGLYVRGAESGIYKVKGMQVDLGAPHKDGSVMRVTDSTFTWYAEITKALDSGYLKTDGWNELAVDMQGNNLKTYINGKLIWSGVNVAGIAATGILALQLHSGDDNDISFKDLEVLTPTRIPYCPTPGDPAYKAGNDPDPALCKTVGIRIIGNPLIADKRFQSPGWMIGPTPGSAAVFWTPVENNHDVLFNLRGARLPASVSQTRESGSRNK